MNERWWINKKTMNDKKGANLTLTFSGGCQSSNSIMASAKQAARSYCRMLSISSRARGNCSMLSKTWKLDDGLSFFVHCNNNIKRINVCMSRLWKSIQSQTVKALCFLPKWRSSWDWRWRYKDCRRNVWELEHSPHRTMSTWPTRWPIHQENRTLSTSMQCTWCCR